MTSPLRAFAAFLALVLSSGVAVVAAQTPASATETVLCTGYAGCRALGMSDSGYQAANRTMYWRMYTGHNCTNYVAYRMVQSGMANVRPWSGDGNASNWGLANRTLTNQTPTVGSVAWWGAYSGGHGGAGHVAYVEQVISPDEIVVSQDSWGGDFSWSRLTRAGGRWPSGFVHLDDQRISNVAPPSVLGMAKVGTVLTAVGGAWSPADVSLRYVWKADGVRIPGVSGASLPLTRDLQGKQINVRVVAYKTGYSAVGLGTARTDAVLPGVIANTVAPTVTGIAQVDQPLQATAGSWDPQPDTVAYQWYAGDAPIAGATSATFTPAAAQVNQPLHVSVTATKDGYDDVSADSASTAAVAPGTFTVTAPAKLQLPAAPSRRVLLGDTLSVQPMQVTPAADTVSVQWLRDGVPIEGATGTTYQATQADLGARLAALVAVSRDGYTTASSTTRATWQVRARTALSARLVSLASGKTRVVVHASAPGVAEVTGPLRIRMRHTLLAEVDLRGGTAATVLTGVSPDGPPLTLHVPGGRENTAATVRGIVPAALGYPAGSVRSVFAGQSLSLDPGSMSGAAGQVQWLRGGSAVDGATATTYPVTAADLGQRLRALVRYTDDTGSTVTTLTPTTRLVRAQTTIDAQLTSPRHGRVRVVAQVKAPGVDEVAGLLQVRWAGKLLKQVRLRHGGVRTVVTGLPGGTRRVYLHYVPTHTTTGSWLHESLDVR